MMKGRKCGREGAAFSLSHWRHWQSVERRPRACSSRSAQSTEGREGEEKAPAVALGLGSLGMRSSELGWVGVGPGLG